MRYFKAKTDFDAGWRGGYYVALTPEEAVAIVDYDLGVIEQIRRLLLKAGVIKEGNDDTLAGEGNEEKSASTAS
jgi:hypothetical protein